MVTLHITDRAALEVYKIEEYSRKEWGKQQANKYINDIDKILDLLREHPNLLRAKPEISKHLKFYTSGEHTLIFEKINNDIYFITIKYAGMELDKRIAELEPTLRKEVEIMHKKVIESRKPGRRRLQ